jgi:hypothetical protein
MAFSEFRYPEVLTQLGLSYAAAGDLFPDVPPLPPLPATRDMLRITTRLATMNNNEKARSEWIVAPLLGDVWGRYDGRVGLYSGIDFQADPAAGLVGFCDFAFCRGPQQVTFTPPTLLVFEAKRDNLHEGLGQCVAGVVGAQRFNRRHGVDEPHLYGCVTTGSLWQFLRLSGTTLTLDMNEYNTGQLDRILGVIAAVIAPPPVATAA